MKGDDRHTLRKINPSAPNRSRSYDLPICTSDAAPLSDRRIVAGYVVQLGIHGEKLQHDARIGMSICDANAQ